MNANKINLKLKLTVMITMIPYAKFQSHIAVCCKSLLNGMRHMIFNANSIASCASWCRTTTTQNVRQFELCNELFAFT